MISVPNMGKAKKNDNTFITDTTEFNYGESKDWTIDKYVEGDPDNTKIYFPGDSITFTIKITNNATKKIYGVTFEDQVPAQISLPTSSPYGVTTTEGTIVAPSPVNFIKVTGIDLDGGETCTITITGIIV